MPQSLQCPRCNGSVKIADEAAGQRVRCPHCQQTFLAPGIAATESDEDDWLTLEDLPAVAPSPKPSGSRPAAPSSPGGGRTGPNQPARSGSGPGPGSRPAGGSTAKSGSGAGRGFSPEEEALLAEFTSDLDDFTAELDTPPPPAARPSAPAGRPPAGNAIRRAGSPSSSPGSGKSSPVPGTPQSGGAAPDAAEPIEYAKDYRVTCNICGSFLYAKASQAGKTVKCSDCHSPIQIPPPPRIRKKLVIDIDQAETFQFESNPKVERRPDPFQKSANELLEEAAREEEETTSPKYDDTPSVVEWLKGIFSPFKDLGVLVHLAGLCVLACVPTLLVLKIGSPILTLGLFPGGFFLGLLTISCGMAILQSVANDEPSVTEWPTLDPLGWIGQLFVVGSAAILAAVPIWAVCMIVLGPQLLSVAITMFSIYVFFPFILLSMLDMGSVFTPFSSEVARSVTKCEEAWGGFYFSAGLLFVATFLLFSTASTMSPMPGAVLAIITAETATFLYFGMIGRLAYAIGQAVNAPPRDDEVDRTRHTDVA